MKIRFNRTISVLLAVLVIVSSFSMLLTVSAEGTGMTPMETVNYYGTFENGITGDITKMDDNPQIFRFCYFSSYGLDSEVYYEGTHSFKVIPESKDAMGFVDLALEANTSYEFSTYVYSADEAANLRVELSNAGSGSKATSLEKGKWTKVAYEFTAEKAGTYRIAVKGLVAGKTYYFDNFSINKKAKAMTKIETINYFGTFENGITGNIAENGNPQVFRFYEFTNPQVSDEKVFEGKYSYKCVANDANSTMVLIDVDLAANTAYEFSTYVYSADQSSTLRVEIQQLSAQQNYSIDQGRWRRIHYAFTTTTAQQYRIAIKGFTAGKTYYFDNYSFNPLTAQNAAKIVNPDFEDTDIGLAAWSSATLLSQSMNAAKDGDWSGCFAVDETNAGGSRLWRAVFQFFAVEKNTNYTISYDAMKPTDISTYGMPIIKVLPANGNTAFLESRVITGGTTANEWKHVTLSFNSGDNNLLRLLFSLSDPAYIDNIEITKVYKAQITAIGRGTASVSKSVFNAGESVTLTATPDAGAEFFGWYSNNNTLISENAVYTFNPTDDFNYTARFTGINENTPFIYNSDFEGNDLSAWTDNANILEFITDDVNSGSKSLRIKSKDEVAQWSNARIGIYVEKNTDYVLSFYGKREADNSATLIHIYGETVNDQNIVYKNNRHINGLRIDYSIDNNDAFDHSEWGRNEISFNSGDHSYIQIVLQVSNGASYIDDLYLAKQMGTYSANNDEYGSVFCESEALYYGKDFTMEATPNDGYNFAGWHNSKSELASVTRVLNVTATEEESYVAKFKLAGDVDGNDEINAGDLTLLRQKLLGAVAIDFSDVNNDDVVDIRDLVAFKKIYANMDK